MYLKHTKTNKQQKGDPFPVRLFYCFATDHFPFWLGTLLPFRSFPPPLLAELRLLPPPRLVLLLLPPPCFMPLSATGFFSPPLDSLLPWLEVLPGPPERLLSFELAIVFII
jgi:hypothetical protein